MGKYRILSESFFCFEKAARNKYAALDLSVNQRTSLPPEIGELRNLGRLDLSRNALKSLPAEIVKLSGAVFLRPLQLKLESIETNKLYRRLNNQ